MVKTDFYPKRVDIPIWHVSFLVVLFLFLGITANSQSTFLACNDQIHLSLDGDCVAYITPDIVLEGEENYPAPYNDLSNYMISIETASGSGISGIEVTIPGSYNVSIIETYSGLNNSCWGTVIVEDKLPPVIVGDPCPCPVGNNNPECVITATCSDLDNMLAGHYDDVIVPQYEDCSTVDLNYVDLVSEYGPCSPIKIQRQYKLVDAGGNETTTCIYEYSVNPIDIHYDIHHPFGHIELPCGAGFSTDDVYDHYYNIKLEILLAGANSTEEVEAAELAAQQYANTYAYPTIHGKPIWNSLCNLAIVKSDLVIPACEACTDLTKVLRTWSYFDWCTGENYEHTQIIVNGDPDGPTIWHPDFSMSVDPWGCFGDFYMPYPEHLHDDCSNNLSYSVTGPYGVHIEYEEGHGYHVTGAPKGVHTFYYHGHDCCNNITTHPVQVHIVDATPPVAVAGQDIIVSLVPDANGEGIAKLYAGSVDKGSHDGCGPVKLEVRRDVGECGFEGNTTYNDDFHLDDDKDDPDNGEYVKFCCSDISENGFDSDGDGINDYSEHKVWLRVWDDGDMDGYYGTDGDNYNETWAIVRLEDKSPPQVVCPPDITIDCDTDINDFHIVGQAQAYNSCGEAEVIYEDIDDNFGCGSGTFQRKWSVVGYPHAFCIQDIYVHESYYSNIEVFFPQDTVINCADNLENERPYWDAPSCNLLAYSVERDTFLFEDGACFKILNHWTVIDWCTYQPLDPYTSGLWEHVQIVKIYDNDAPTFVDTCDEMIMKIANDYGDEDGDGIICENNATTLIKIAQDNGDCASDWIKWTVQVDLWGDWTYDYTFSSTAPYDSPFYLDPTSSGEPVRVVIPEGIPGSMINHRVVWKATDGCGNVVSCTQDLMIVDKKAPTPYCVNISSAIMDNGEVELWACDFDLGSFDNCSANADLRFTFSEVHPDEDPDYNPDTKCSSRIFNCDDIINAAQPNPVEVDVYVWDEKDNVDFCTVYLTLIDNQGVCPEVVGQLQSRIGGQLTTVSGEELAQFSVELNSPSSEFPLLNMTDDHGHYIFNNNPFGLDYSINASSRTDWLNGVSTLDLVLMQKHILSLTPLTDPYDMIAADINNDENISAIDLVELRKVILGINTEFPNNDSWRFPITEQNMNATNPWPFSETVNIQSFSSTMMDNNFIGVKVGDINNTAVVTLDGNNTQSRSGNKWALYTNAATVNADGQYEIVIKSVANQKVAGMQFTINHAGMNLLEVKPGILDASNANVGMVSNDNSTFSWNTGKALNIDKDEALMTLVFENDGQLSISNELLSSEAYIGSALTEVEVILQGVKSELVNKLYQNEPNPFNNETSIGFMIAEEGMISLKIMDVSGRVLKQINEFYPAGYNELVISKEDFDTSGLMYYQFESGDFSAVKKMILVK